MDKISIKITTKSNLFIGGAPTTFEIGGIDLSTITDYEGYPYIPASSFKGTLRNIVRELIESGDNSICKEIKGAYIDYLINLKEENIKKINKKFENSDISRGMEVKYNKEIDNASAEFLFGIEGLNNTPKLIFNDLVIVDRNTKDLFSIDSKNSIDYGSNKSEKISALPRTYKTVRPGVTFSGDILFYNMKSLNLDINTIKEFIESAIKEFNEGIYRLGNSGSRGYGRVSVEVKGA